MGDNKSSLLGISAFARRVGLTPSALRFYDDCAVLRPAEVDAATGYRYYHPEQEERAVLLRRLRAAEVSLTDAVAVLDGSAEQAEKVLRNHLRRAREKSDTARAAIDELLRSVSGGRVSADVDGAELAGALRQVAPAVGDGEVPALNGVLLELGDAEVRVVATDRYRLSLRVLNPVESWGGPCRYLLANTGLAELGRWAAREARVVIEGDADGLRFRGAADSRDVSTVDAEFPAYREVLAALAAPEHRVVADRLVLRDAVLGSDGTRVVLELSEDELLVAGGKALAVLYSGPGLTIAFDPVLLGQALDASVGPDVLLEISGAAQPVVVRSADQGSFTTLVMPVAL
ncbi:MerR family transcriptional regulator [Amycolatopsis nigrescens]|uniref:DNA polymerase III subunit beta family protein n=1 Tax=Amycolatopsis nigrescens TaxID=381445 RepID=UPI000374808A|nr:MerR family transcriptional regulator [Amycolatopsis nigrescens]